MKKLADGKFAFQLNDQTVNVAKITGEPAEGGAAPTIPPQLGSIIQQIKGSHEKGKWSGEVSIRDTAMDVLGAKIHVHASKVSYKSDKKLNGAIKASGGNEGGSIEAKIEM